MKIGILTIHNALNYGALFQAYATQKVFSRYGEVEIINYQNEHIDKLYRPFTFYRMSFSWKAPLQFVREIYLYKSKLRKQEQFCEFWSSLLNISKRSFYSGELLDGYDVVVCGSDQVWNPRITNSHEYMNKDYFLARTQAGSRKISYASSLGNYRYSLEEVTDLKFLLEGFDCLSIRERDGAEYLKEVLKRDVQVVLDPTLLLKKEEWVRNLGLKENYQQDDYILVYTVPRSKELRKAVNYYATSGFCIKSIDPGIISLGRVDEQIRDAGPNEFLDLILNAKLILTDSFHGVCFSINFRKNFLAFGSGGSSNRVISLLSILGLESRFIESADMLDKVNPISESLYDAAFRSLDIQRGKSFKYINDSMKYVGK